MEVDSVAVSVKVLGNTKVASKVVKNSDEKGVHMVDLKAIGLDYI